MLVVLSGKTCSGKTTVQEELVKNWGCQKIVTYTTRPIRPGEVDGETYNFLSREEFLKRKAEGFFLETAEYHTLVDNIPDTWYYGSAKEDFERASADMLVYIIILQQAGLEALKKSDIGYTAIYLDISEEEILARQTGRKDNLAEAQRRLLADREAFRGITDLVDASIDVDKLSAEGVATSILTVAGRMNLYNESGDVKYVKSEGRLTYHLNGGYSTERKQEAAVC